MTIKTKDFFEGFLFFTLTLAIYSLFIFTLPIAQEAHGWITLNGFDNPLWSGGIDVLIFGSAFICVLLGVVTMIWVPALSPQVIRNLWVLTYFFIWIDTVFVLTLEYQTIGFLLRLILGLIFILLFFYFIEFMGMPAETDAAVAHWKTQLIQYWTYGWMSFYFTVSFLLVYNSFKYSDFRLPLAAGAMSVCFINYVFSLFIQKAQGKNTDQYSRFGRTVFAMWLLILIGCWLGQKWNF